jgi:DNA-binding transcriptional ArsR family regulator
MDNKLETKQDNTTILQVTPEQAKLLESALRFKIMHALAEEPLTSKQVADKLQKTAGNIHYHISKLYDGGLLELVRTEAVGGIIQKFYRSKGTVFCSEHFAEFQFSKEDTIQHFNTRLTLSESELNSFQSELQQFLAQWESKVTHGKEYGVHIAIGHLPQSPPEKEFKS